MKLKNILTEMELPMKDKLFNVLNNNKSHFSSFLKPKSYMVHTTSDTITIIPASKSFAIKVDFVNNKIDTTEKPPYPESVSYTEMLEIVKKITKFK
jgi:hypothetical protein